MQSNQLLDLIKKINKMKFELDEIYAAIEASINTEDTEKSQIEDADIYTEDADIYTDSPIVYMVAPAADLDEAKKCAWRWRPLGYKIMYVFDEQTLGKQDPSVLIDENIIESYIILQNYRGWYATVNLMMRMAVNRGAEWVVAIGTDMDPDPSKTAQQIATENNKHFNGTFGVMQPTGDDWDIKNGKCAAERIVGSGWFGRDYILKEEHPYPENFFHYFGDEALLERIKDKLFFWQRQDLTHLHRHPNREARQKPGYLGKTWKSDKKKFQKMKKNIVEQTYPDIYFEK